jgi:hypothetical protein
MTTCTPASMHTPLTLNELWSKCKEPIKQKEIKGMVISGVASLLFTANPIAIVTSIGLSLLASRIDSLVRPILREFVEPFIDSEFPEIANFTKTVLKNIVVITTVACTGNFISKIFKLSLVIDAFFMIFINCFFSSYRPNPYEDLPEGKAWFILA